MELLQAIRSRHSVRTYLDKPIHPRLVKALQAAVDVANLEGGLNIQLITQEPDAFGSFLCHYGMFRGVKHYIALVGPKDATLPRRCGYYGQRLVLLAQALGLRTCWVAATYGKKKVPLEIPAGRKLVCVIALGYGASDGKPHKSKPLEALCRVQGEMPAWFKSGMEAVMLAPSAVNRQSVRFHLTGENTVRPCAASGWVHQLDLGIAMLHFELGAGKETFTFE